MSDKSTQKSDEKRLHRSKIDKIIGGVCGGFAEYFSIDSTLMRILWIIFGLMGFGIIAYIACLIIMRENPTHDPAQAQKPQNTPILVGVALVIIGLSILSSNMHWFFGRLMPFHWNFYHFDLHNIFPLLLIIAGIFYIYHIVKKDKMKENDTTNQPNDIFSSEKKFTRSIKDKMISGVCAGIADYVNIDPVLIRLLWVVITIFSGVIFGIIFYIVLVIIIPENKFNQNMKVMNPETIINNPATMVNIKMNPREKVKLIITLFLVVLT